jgi:phospholipid/cholesterol/gamma-HCH transport system substrate-binding protein
VKNVRATVLVGLLTLVSLGLIVIGVARSNRGVSGQDTYSLYAWFDDVTGIASGTKITIAGYKVGQVEDVKLQGTRVRVKLKLLRSVEAYGGTRNPAGLLVHAAALQRVQASFLGDFYLELTPGAAGPKLKENDEVPIVVTATGMQQTLQRLETASEIVPKITKIADDIGKITDNAARVLGNEGGQQRFEEIADNLVKASRELSLTTEDLRTRLGQGVLGPGGDLDKGLKNFASATGKADRMIDDAGRLLTQGGNSAQRSLENVEKITKSVRDLVGRNGGQAETAMASLQDTMVGVQKTLARIDRVAAKLEDVVERMDRGEGNVGRLLKDETLVRSTEAVVDNAKKILEKYTALETGLDYRIAGYAQHKPDNLAWQSHLSLRLQPREDRFVLATVTTDNLGKVTYLDRVTDTTGPSGQSGKLTERFRETENTFKLGIQYARKFGPLTVRGGLIESTAGAGLDVRLASERLILSGDVFRFTQSPWPRVRVAASWEFFQHVYAWLGGDELMFPSTRADFFAGFGLSFTDNDLKILFASAPAVSTR